MWIVVDGYNLIRRSPKLASLDRRDLKEGRDALLGVLAAYRRLKGHRTTVVFDGWERGGAGEQATQVAGVRVIFSRRGDRADQAILRLVEKAPAGAVVVTSDRALAEAAGRLGAIALSAEEFEERLERTLREGGEDGVEEEDEGASEAVRPGPRKMKGAARRPSKQARRRSITLGRL
jgi:predicted RNA-binding protein with PIN domain